MSTCVSVVGADEGAERVGSPVGLQRENLGMRMADIKPGWAVLGTMAGG